MATIRFSIGTQSFTLSCEEGEEAHIRQLEQSVNRRFETIQRTFGTAGNQLVMAVTMLMMEEDLQTLKKGEVPSLQTETANAPTKVDEEAIRQHARAEALNEVSERLESLAQTIEKV